MVESLPKYNSFSVKNFFSYFLVSAQLENQQDAILSLQFIHSRLTSPSYYKFKNYQCIVK